eukprot:9499440-Pyramimonas_sp.AAC.1
MCTRRVTDTTGTAATNYHDRRHTGCETILRKTLAGSKKMTGGMAPLLYRARPSVITSPSHPA